MQCRICLLEGNQENDPLISPCDCKGSIRFVHLECLRHWINGRLNFHEQQHKPIFVRQLLCELCKIPYPTAISYNNERMQVVTVPKTEPPFLVLENMVGSHQKGVHVISMSSKKDLKLGRGHESDVRIPDVSISRYHATIRFVDGNFQLEDHNSKFGTLVSLRKAFSIGDTVAALQVGRSVVKLSVDSTPATSDAIVEVSEVAPNPTHFSETPGHFVEQPGAENAEQQQQQQHEHQQQDPEQQEEALALFPIPQDQQGEAAADAQRPLFLSPFQRHMIQQHLERDAAARTRQHYYEHAARFSGLAARGPSGDPMRTHPLLSDSAASCADGVALTAIPPAAPYHHSLMQQQLQQFACLSPPPPSTLEPWQQGASGASITSSPHSASVSAFRHDGGGRSAAAVTESAAAGAISRPVATSTTAGACTAEDDSAGSTPQEMDIETETQAARRNAELAAML